MQLPLITNIQKYSIHDGEGIRTTVFFKGCPLKCVWCHNPETQKYTNCPMFYAERCTGCASCINACPEKAISLKGEKAATDLKKCAACGTCLDECVNNAREICAKSYTVSELEKELLKDQMFYETSHGGVTLSGGEVLAQDLTYVEELIQRLSGRGIRVNIDTCGAVPFEAFERVLPYTHTFLYDIKILDEAKHLRYTGSSNRGILENLRKLSKKGADIWIRIPVIGSVNDTEEEIGGIGTFLRDCQIHMSQVNLLPYHDTGSSKYQRLSIQYGGGDFYTPSDERMQELKMLMETYVNVPVLIGG